MTRTNPLLTPASAEVALADVCQRTGLDRNNAELLRMGENAIFRTADGVIVRIGRSPETSSKEVRVARWLEAAQFPAARLHDELPQPMMANGFSVTFWRFIRETAPPPSPADLGSVLQNLHSLVPSADLDLPMFSPIPKLAARLRDLPKGALPQSDTDFLRRRGDELQAEFETLQFELPAGVIHGDAHGGNLMRDENGAVLLIDFEDFAWGPREWDASMAAIRYQVFGRLSRSEYESYVSTYGFDPLLWSGFPVLRAIRELNMTAWLMQQLGQSAEVDAEVKKRLADLRNDQFPRFWGVF